MPLNLTYTKIRRLCDDLYFERGRDYYQQGRVISLEVEREADNLIVFRAQVRGSGGRVYGQFVRIQERYGSLALKGECSCPVGYNCKHVVAACFRYLNLYGDRPRLTLDLLRSPQSVGGPGQPGETVLFYRITLDREQAAPLVELCYARIRKNGQPGALRPAKAGMMSDPYYGSRYHFPDYVNPEDRPIVHLIDALREEFSLPLLKGRLGCLALRQMIDTGRCFVGGVDRPLRLTEEVRPVRFQWRPVSGGKILEAIAEPEARVIPTDPPLWLDLERGEAGPLAQVPRPELLTAPFLPETDIPRFTSQLLLEFPELPVPPPVELPLEEIQGQTPVPELTLALHGEGDLPYRLRLGFDYQGIRVMAGGAAVGLFRGKDKLIRFRRDEAAETAALGRLETAGFVLEQEGVLVPADADAGRLRHFVEEVLPCLEAEGWRIEREAGFNPRFLDEDQLEASTEEDEAGWFDLRFDLDLDGQKVPVLPLLVPLLERYDRPEDLPETVTVPLGEQRFLTLRAEKLRPFLEILYELYDRESDSLQLSRYDAARLAELEDASLRLKGAEKLRELGRRLRDFQGLAPVSPPRGLRCELRPYQAFGLSWLQFLREYELGGILADDMGLGKTVQTLAHLLLEKEQGRLDRPALVVAPTSLMSNWRREAERFAPDLKVLVLHGPQRHEHFSRIGEHDLVLTTYPLLPRDEEVLKAQAWSFLILDEAQTVKNPRTQAARIVRRLQARHRLCLTGTPLENHLGELWAQFDFLMPGFLGDLEQFTRLYRTPIEKHGDEDCRRRLARRVAPFLLRRTKAEVEKDLPPKTEMVRSVALHPKQAAVYESIRVAMESQVRQAIETKGLARSQIAILDALLKLRQVCCDPRLVKLDKAKVVPSAKLDLLAEMLPELLAEGRRVLLFSQFTSMLGRIEEAILKPQGIPYAKLTGQTRKRDEAIERFKRGDVDLFLISLKAGGVGLNLTEADTVILYDPWWNPAVEAQATDRAHRIGQDKPVFVYKLLTEGTVEERILKLQARKQALAQGIYGRKAKTAPTLTAEDLQVLLAPLG
ncbi:hypothetical protein MIT9_P0866 [Methylomarinovum caldicuralii]|uniref:Helicase SNF2 n=1 Tax=Methylomarinovum caldicuralii TaxID=438856 RepID=A0AAU9BR78_9GAMM|nr:DEAD/DEAH box helicase [Methylomarinovum caldicuralii]BCX81288.1 hypothetical protein MIT9_P0866 [Methylomarinovum caldicuralii]